MADYIAAGDLVLVPLKPWHITHVKACHAIWTDAEAMKWSTLPLPTNLRASDARYRPILRTPGSDDNRSYAVFTRADAHLLTPCLGVVTLLPTSTTSAATPATPATAPGNETPIWTLTFHFTARAWAKGYPEVACRAAIEDLDSDLLGTKRASGSLLSLRCALGRRKGLIRACMGAEDERGREVCGKLGFERVGSVREGEGDLLFEKCLEHENAVSPLVLVDEDDERI